MKLDLATIAYNSPWAISEQIRLFTKHLRDDHQLNVYDNSSDLVAANETHRICRQADIRYVRSPTLGKRLHEPALRHAGDDLLNRQAPYIGFLDHDVFPTRPTSLLALVEPAGFFGLGQRHEASGRRYLWPGLCVFRRTWLGDRPRLDFAAITGTSPGERGDTGSGIADLFTESDWAMMPLVKHAYLPIRPDDGAGTQSYAVEQIGDFIHLGNLSRWLAVPDPEGRERELRAIVSAL